ncbi:hypothetical protein LTR28_008849, partial [Elasticomyces elasticus]
MSTQARAVKPRRFAPLRDANDLSEENAIPELKGIVFDMDGTLCEPQNHMFSEMRSALGIPKGEDILDYIYALPEKEQQEALDKIEAVERKAMKEQKPQAGLICLMEYLDKKRIRKGICTRNF